MDAADIAARRMHGHRLWGDPLDSPDAVVEWLGALQAQEFVPAKWSVAQRAAAVRDHDMDEAIADGTVLRTHVVRPTWHFARPRDIGWLLTATRERVHALNRSYYRKFGVEGAAYELAKRLLTGALTGGNQLTREEIGDLLDRGGLTARGLHLGYILMRAELDGLLISGAPAGKRQTYALYTERVPTRAAVPRSEALTELASRYFRSRGPATVKDFARWASLTVADATAALESVKGDLVRVEAAGRTYWCPPDPPASSPDSPRVDLVQGYDEIVMSYSESKDVLHPPSLGADPYDAAYLHAILLDGRLVGHWKHTRTAREVVVETSFHRGLGAAESAAVDEAVHRFGNHFGLEGRRGRGPAAAPTSAYTSPSLRRGGQGSPGSAQASSTGQ